MRVAQIVVLAFLVVAIGPSPVGAGGTEAGPAHSVPVEDALAALHCPAEFDPAREPVLLVHGTGTDSTKWDGNYAGLLPPLGFDVCTIDLPAEAMGDIQVASEYVVHAVRAIRNATGQSVDVVGHSQGALEIRWAARWWPDVAESIDDAISLAGSNHGTTLADGLCTAPCAAAMWQQATTSKFLAALNAGDETPAGPSWTSIYSADDGAVTPYTSSTLDGATNIEVQALCPGRSVDHNRMILDAVVFAVVLDALTHSGTADATRFDPAICDDDLAPGADPPPDDVTAAVETAEFLAIVATASPLLVAEPALAAYATPTEQPPTTSNRARGGEDEPPDPTQLRQSIPLPAPSLPSTGGTSTWTVTAAIVTAAFSVNRYRQHLPR